MNPRTTATCIALTIATAAPLLLTAPATAVTPLSTLTAAAVPAADTGAADIVAHAGVYDLTARPDHGDSFGTGDTGVVSYNLLTRTDWAGFVPPRVKKGESMSWVTTLPKGLALNGEVKDTSLAHAWAQDYTSEVNQDGTTTITGKYTAKYSDQALTSHPTPVSIPVRATTDLDHGAEVASTFNPPAGYASNTPDATVTVPKADVDADAGVYDLTATPDDGAGFTAGSTGSVSYKMQGDIADGFVPAVVKKRESVSWTTTLPTGLSVDEDAEIIDGNVSRFFDREYTSIKNPDGTTDVTGTWTAKGSDRKLQGYWKPVEIPVEATETLQQDAVITSTFAPPVGYTNEGHLTASAAVPVADGVVADAGVYGLKATATDGGGFVSGTNGYVQYDVQGDQGAPGFVPAVVEQGETVSWTTTLPESLSLNGEVLDGNTAAGFDREYTSKENGDGTTTVTGTYTALDSARELVGNTELVLIPVTATDALERGDTVTSTFTPPAGFTSNHLSATAEIPIDVVADAGVYDLNAAPDQSDSFVPGASGSVSYVVQGDQDDPGFVPAVVEQGKSATWVTTLPKGLKPLGDVEDSNSSAGFKRTYTAVTNDDDTTTITGRYIALDADRELTDNMGRITIPVEATSELKPGAKVESTFTPPAGYTSNHGDASVAVPVREEVPVPEFAVTSPADGATVETTDRKVHVTGTAGEGVANVKTPSGALVGSVPTANGEWNLDMVGVPDGENLTAVAYYVPTGGKTQQMPFTFTHVNTNPAPEFAVTSPADGATVETTDRKVHVTGTAGEGVANVKTPSGALVGSVPTANGAWNLDMVGVPDGENLTAVAYYVPTGGKTQQTPFTFTHTKKVNS